MAFFFWPQKKKKLPLLVYRLVPLSFYGYFSFGYCSDLVRVGKCRQAADNLPKVPCFFFVFSTIFSFSAPSIKEKWTPQIFFFLFEAIGEQSDNVDPLFSSSIK